MAIEEPGGGQLARHYFRINCIPVYTGQSSVIAAPLPRLRELFSRALSGKVNTEQKLWDLRLNTSVGAHIFGKRRN